MTSNRLLGKAISCLLYVSYDWFICEIWLLRRDVLIYKIYVSRYETWIIHMWDVTLNDMLDHFQELVKEGKVICLSYVRHDLFIYEIGLIRETRLHLWDVTLNDMLDDNREAIIKKKVVCLSYMRRDLLYVKYYSYNTYDIKDLDLNIICDILYESYLTYNNM